MEELHTARTQSLIRTRQVLIASEIDANRNLKYTNLSLNGRQISACVRLSLRLLTALVQEQYLRGARPQTLFEHSLSHSDQWSAPADDSLTWYTPA